MIINGKIHEIFETKALTSTFNKREFIVEYAENPKYPQYIKFEVIQDKCSILDKYIIGDAVEVNYNLQGKPFTDKKGETIYFNSLQCWKLNKVGAEPETNITDEDKEDLPFWKLVVKMFYWCKVKLAFILHLIQLFLI